MADKLVFNTTELSFGNACVAPLHSFVSDPDGGVTLVQDDGDPFNLSIEGNFNVSSNLVVQGVLDIDSIDTRAVTTETVDVTDQATLTNTTIGSSGVFDVTDTTLTLGNHVVIEENSSTTTVNGTVSANTILVDGLNVKDRIVNASASTVRYYVKTNGSNTNDGRSWDRAFLTIKYAASQAPSGSTIYVETGTYVEDTPIRLQPRVAILGDNLRLCILKAVNPKLDYFHVTSLCYLYGLRFVDLQRPAFCCAFPCAIAEPTIQNGALSSIEILYSPTGYTSVPPVIIAAPENLSGTQATGTAVLTNGVVTSVTITYAGTGYTERPHISIPSSSRPFITGSPYIQNCSSITGPFDKQFPAQKIPETRQLPYDYSDVDQEGAGGGCRIDGAVCYRGTVGSITITNGGTGYTSPPTVVFSDGTATGTAVLTGTSVSSVTITNSGSYVNIPTMTFVGGGGNGAVGIVVMAVPPSPLRSFVADSFTQVNQGGPGHLVINLGYAQFVSCFTTFCSYSYKAVAGGFTNISTSVTDFGNYGLVSSGYWPIPIASGTVSQTYRSSVVSVTISDSGQGVGGVNYTTDPYVLFSTAGYSTTSLVPSDTLSGDGLGTVVSISADGTRVAGGAPTKTYLTNVAAGAVYVFNNNVQEAKILAPTPSANAQFGYRVAVSGDGTRLVASSYGDQRVYVYARSGSSWTYEAELLPSDRAAGDAFGSSLAITADGSRIVGGSPNHDPSGTTNAGAVYVFSRSGTTWNQEAKLVASDRIANAGFGESLSIGSTAGSTVLIGAPRDNPTGNAGTLDAGSVYGFTRVDTTWTQIAKVTANDASPSDAFGTSVSLSADATRFVVGAPTRNSLAVVDTGAVYVFQGSGASWTQEAMLTTSDKSTNDTFGYGVAMNSDGTRLVSGSRSKAKAYIFVRKGTNWAEYDTFTTSPTESLYGNRGVAISGSDTVMGKVVVGSETVSKLYLYSLNQPAEGTAVRFVTKVNSVLMTNGGSYKTAPTVQFLGGGGTGAAGTVKLQAPQIIVVTNATGRRPDIGSVTKYGNSWYTIVGAALTSAGVYSVTFYPPIYATEAGDTINFYIASQVSTGGHVTEYIGSGVTYNALPEYGGVPNAGNKYLEITPGKVYFNISDHLGNQEIGKYFAVDQLTGAVTIKTDQFSLSGLVGISFDRGGSIKEVSNDPNLVSSTGAPDSETVPTQYAVYTYVNRRTVPAAGNAGFALVKYTSNDFDVSWQSVVMTNQKNIANGVAGLDATGRIVNANIPLTLTPSNIYVANGSVTTPSYSFVGQASDVGMYSPSANTLGFSTGGIKRLGIEPSGYVGIGIEAAATLHVNGRVMIEEGVIQRGTPLFTSTNHLGLYSRTSGDPVKFMTNGGNFTWYADNAGSSYAMQLTSAGALSAIGDITAFASDTRLKTNIQKIQNPLDKLARLNGVSFDWNPETPQPMRGHDIGLLAQDVQAVLPEAVCLAPFDSTEDGTSKSGNDYLTVTPGNRLIALLVESVKDLAARVEYLESQVTQH